MTPSDVPPPPKGEMNMGAAEAAGSAEPRDLPRVPLRRRGRPPRYLSLGAQLHEAHIKLSKLQMECDRHNSARATLLAFIDETGQTNDMLRWLMRRHDIDPDSLPSLRCEAKPAEGGKSHSVSEE